MDDDSAPARAQSLEPAVASDAAAVAPANHTADTKQDHNDNASTQSHTTSHEKDVAREDHVVQQQKQEQSDESAKNDYRKTRSESVAGDENTDYITGVKLYVVMASVALTCFVMLLDTSIISTVGIRGRRVA